jgi:hypothetical protein
MYNGATIKRWNHLIREGFYLVLYRLVSMKTTVISFTGPFWNIPVYLCGGKFTLEALSLGSKRLIDGSYVLGVELNL